MRVVQFLVVSIAAVQPVAAQAQPHCTVSDVNAAALIVYDAPNGLVRTSLYNGAMVAPLASITDEHGRSWSLVQRISSTMLGWVHSEALKCYDLPSTARQIGPQITPAAID